MIRPGIIIFFLCIHITACREKRLADISPVRGEILVQFAGKNSNYKWNFTRSITSVLKPLQKNELYDMALTDIRFSKQMLVGLNYKASSLLFFDNHLRNTAFFSPKGDSTVTNKGILYFDYKGDEIVLYDFGSRCVKRYNAKDHSLLYIQKIKDPGVYRAACLFNNTYIYALPQDEAHDLVFAIFDSASNNITASYSLNNVMNFKKKQDYPGMAYDGKFIDDDAGKYVVYYCSFAGYFFCFSRSDGKLLFHSATVDRTPAPIAAYVPISPEHKSLEIIPSVLFFPSACLNNSKLYLLNSITSTGHSIADIYDLDAKGAYAGSVYIPPSPNGERPASITADNETLYVLYKDQSIVKYAISKL